MTTMSNEAIIKMLTIRIETKLAIFAAQMPEGIFLNLHNDEADKASAIVMLETGDICPIFRHSMCCLNPLQIGGEDETVSLSTSSVAGNIYPQSTLTKTVEKYNEELRKAVERGFLSFGRRAIIGYHSFDPEW